MVYCTVLLKVLQRVKFPMGSNQNHIFLVSTLIFSHTIAPLQRTKLAETHKFVLQLVIFPLAKDHLPFQISTLLEFVTEEKKEPNYKTTSQAKPLSSLCTPCPPFNQSYPHQNKPIWHKPSTCYGS